MHKENSSSRPYEYCLRAVATLSQPPQPLVVSTLPLPSLLNVLLLSNPEFTLPFSYLPTITHTKVLDLLIKYVVRTSSRDQHASLTAQILSLSYTHSRQAYRHLCSALHVRTALPSAPIGREDCHGRIMWKKSHDKNAAKEGEVAVRINGGVVVAREGKVWSLFARGGKTVWSGIDGLKVDENFQKVRKGRRLQTQKQVAVK